MQFLSIIENHPQPQVRQLSAVLLKRNVSTLFDELTTENQQKLQNTLLNRFFEEKTKVVRTSLGPIIGLVGMVTIPDKKWLNLFEIISQKTNENQNTDTRILGLSLLGFLFDYVGEALEDYYQEFHSFFAKTIQDPNHFVKFFIISYIIFF